MRPSRHRREPLIRIRLLKACVAVLHIQKKKQNKTKQPQVDTHCKTATLDPFPLRING
jgi:hypothetical protein